MNLKLDYMNSKADSQSDAHRKRALSQILTLEEKEPVSERHLYTETEKHTVPSFLLSRRTYILPDANEHHINVIN